MFLNISSEIVWNSLVAVEDKLTALSGPRRFHDNIYTRAHTRARTQTDSTEPCIHRDIISEAAKA